MGIFYKHDIVIIMNAKFDITGIRLETERLILREWDLTDLDDLFEYASVPGVGECAGWPHHENKVESARILGKFIAEKRTFAIVYKENNKVVGSLGIETYGSEEKLTEFTNYKGRSIGYVLSKDYWGKGLMTEAVRRVIDFLFDELDYDFLLCGYYNFNSRSKRVQQKAGFVPYRKLVMDTHLGHNEPGVLNLLINPKKRIKLEFSHPETLIYQKEVFETPRLLFREFVDFDFYDLRNVIKNHDGTDPSDEYVHRWIDWCKTSYQENGFGHWAVIYKDTNELIGSIGISMQPIDDIWRPEVGYHLRSDYHHQGLAKEGAAASRDYFFSHFHYDEVYSYMLKDNIASYKTAESIGMKFVKTFFTKYGDECRIYKMTRKEWEIIHK